MNRIDLRSAFVVYRLDAPQLEPGKPFFIGCTSLTGLPMLDDARTYKALTDVLTDDDEIRVTVLGIFANRSDAELMQQANVFADNVWINLHSGRCEPPTAGSNNARAQVVNLTTGVVYDNASKAALAMEVSTAAMSKHLNGTLPTIKGQKFKRL